MQRWIIEPGVEGLMCETTFLFCLFFPSNINSKMIGIKEYVFNMLMCLKSKGNKQQSMFMVFSPIWTRQVVQMKFRKHKWQRDEENINT